MASRASRTFFSSLISNRGVHLRAERGFTIVELLIVVVVIAILAGITIVAYNGIQNRAKTSSVQSTLSQSAKALEVEKVKTGTNTYPDTLPSSIRAGSGITLNYLPSSSSSPTGYCLEATIGTIAYHVDSSSTSPQINGCTVTNLVLNPRPSNSFWFASSTGVATLSFVTWSDGTPAARSTRVTTDNYALYSTRGASALATARAGDVYTVLFSIRSSVNTVITFQVGNGTATSSIDALDYPITLVANQTQNIRYTFTIPNANDGQPIFNKFYWLKDVGAVNDYFDVANVMWVKGTYNGPFQYGDSPGWSWSGTPNSSQSSGPSS